MLEKSRIKPASTLQSVRLYKGQIMLLRIIIFLALKLGEKESFTYYRAGLLAYFFCSSRQAFTPSIVPHYLICSYCKVSVSSKQSWQNFYRNVMFTKMAKKKWWWFMLFHSATEMNLTPGFESLFSGDWDGEVGNVFKLRITPFNGSDFALWPTFCKFRLKILCCSVTDFCFSSLFLMPRVFGKKIFNTSEEICYNKKAPRKSARK